MRSVRLFEFEDMAWLPSSIRDAGTDILRFKWEVGRLYRPIVPRLREALLKTGSQRIVDLGSGGGGPALAIYGELVRSGQPVRVTLTDKYPNLAAWRYAHQRSGGGVDFIEEPVDAAAVPLHLSGFRTMFLTLHHFPPETVRRVLLSAVEQRCPIGVFDFAARTLPPPLMMLLSNPLGVLLETPFVRPFRWSRLLWTYLVPVVPLYVAWDAFVSGLRLYSVGELRKIVDGIPADGYAWEIGQEPFPRSLTYLIGYPRP